MDIVDLVRTGDVRHPAYHEAAQAAGPSETHAVVTMLDDPDPAVRAAAVTSLPFLLEEPPSDVVAAVVRLTDDPEGAVRDLACFALGTQWAELDTPPLRDALAAHLGDAHTDARCEALLGLAKRRDARALPALRQALARVDGSLHRLELEAAGALGDPSLHELVLLHQAGWDDDGDPAALATVVRRLTDPAGPGDDVTAGVAALHRRRSAGLDDGDALTWWRVMGAMLDVAPYRAAELLAAVEAQLADDAGALLLLRNGSALAVMVRP